MLSRKIRIDSFISDTRKRKKFINILNLFLLSIMNA
ncbi:hypothetical protein [Campylobacter phage vB_CcoM-IBB_35]|uniref:Uncharacterized protein n=1 Tax=Campylobacter virus IBB35 TaxID=1006972 RepID=H6SUC4_9CAUD|nr:hypothetical protein FDG52_s4gp14 [Campylobacter phage vB_CcoM-IBB_35]AEI88190.1 hypothetical protein [Campylobacter phage vB_CcoM-IBB_35]